jgi:hypothetical protein
VLTVWGVVNVVNILQGVGFLSRIYTGSMSVNHLLGYGIFVLAVPAALALAAFVVSRSGALHWMGPAVFLAFASLMAVVDYIRPVEFRTPKYPPLLIPFLLLFFGAILLMGLPMYKMNRRLWFVTVATTLFLLASMGAAMRRGLG